MNELELSLEVETLFEEKGIPSRWIKLFKHLGGKIQQELLQKASISDSEIPICGGAWSEAFKSITSVGRRRMWILITSRCLCWGNGGSVVKIDPSLIRKIDPQSSANIHFGSRGFYGLRRFTLTMHDGSKYEMPSKGGGAAVSVWAALGLLSIRRRTQSMK